VEEIVLRPRKEGHPDAFGVILGKDRIAGQEIVFPANRARVLLMLIKEIEELVRVIVTVRVHEEKGRKDRFKLINDRIVAVGIDKIAIGRETFDLGGYPIVLDPRPTAVIYIDKVLVVEMNFGEITLIHTNSFWLTKKCRVNF
jgi:hypothetical protein